MITGPGYIFLDIPFAAPQEFKDLLTLYCEGQEVTPYYEVPEEIPEGTFVFSLTRNPYTRVAEIYEAFGDEESTMVEWWTWMRTRPEDPHRIITPYTYWTDHCEVVYKWENIRDTAHRLFKQIGHTVPRENIEELPKPDAYPLNTEESNFIKEKWFKDFKTGLYKTDRRFLNTLTKKKKDV